MAIQKAKLQEGEDYREKLGLLSKEDLVDKPFNWKHAETPMYLSEAFATYAQSLGSKSPEFDAMLMIKRCCELNPAFNPDDPSGLELDVQSGKFTLSKNGEVVISESYLLKEQELSDANERVRLEKEAEAKLFRESLSDRIFTEEEYEHALRVLDYKFIEELDPSMVAPYVAMLKQKVEEGRLSVEDVKDLIFPEKDYAMCLFYSDHFVEEIFSKAGEKYAGDTSNYAQSVLAQYEHLETARANKDLHLQVMAEFAMQFSEEADMVTQDYIFDSEVDVKLPPKEELHTNHTDAIDIFYPDSDIVKEGENEIGPDIHCLQGGIVIATADDWQGGISRETYEGGGLSPVAGNGVVIYNPVTNEYHEYLHFASVSVKAGDVVKAGDILGKGGNTGVNSRKEGHGKHLHYAVHSIDPTSGAVATRSAFELHDRVQPYLTADFEAKEAINEEVTLIHQFLVRSSNFNHAANQLGVNVDEFAKEWSKEIHVAMTNNGIEFNEANLALCITQIEREGTYFEDPLIPDPEEMYGRFRSKLESEIDALADLAGPIKGRVRSELIKFVDKYDTQFKAQILACKTEGQLDEVFAAMVHAIEADPQMQALFELSLVGPTLQQKWNERVEELRHPVKTIGVMQISMNTARRIAEEKGFIFANDDEVREYLYSKEGNMNFGFSLIAKGLNEYVKTGNGNLDHVFADYNAGVYSCRNAAMQNTINQILSKKDPSYKPLVRDGDFLIYKASGEAIESPSNTEKAVNALVSAYNLGFSPVEVRSALMLEKKAGFSETPLYKAIVKAYEAEFGKTPSLAILPTAIAKGSMEKFDRTLSAQTYIQGSNEQFSRIQKEIDAARA